MESDIGTLAVGQVAATTGRRSALRALGLASILTASVYHDSGAASSMSFTCTGSGDTREPQDYLGISYSSNGQLIVVTLSASVPVSGLNPGSHTFTAKYRQSRGAASSASYSWRHMTVIPLP